MTNSWLEKNLPKCVPRDGSIHYVCTENTVSVWNPQNQPATKGVFESKSIKHNPEFTVYAVPDAFQRDAQKQIKTFLKHIYDADSMIYEVGGGLPLSVKTSSEQGAAEQPATAGESK